MTRPGTGFTALVTGAASGIGAATAEALAAEGYKLVLCDRDNCIETATAAKSLGVDVSSYICDVSDEESMLGLFENLDTLDVVVHSAGILIESPIAEMPMQDFDKIMSVNLRGSFLLGKLALPLLQRGGRGRFIAIASELAFPGRADFSAYCASKAALIALVKSWAREYAPDVLVNAVAPGPTATPMLGAGHMSPEALAEESDNPLGRVGRPEEIAAAVCFLAGPGATFMTGQTISPNGGAVM